VRDELELSLRELSQYQIEFRRTTDEGDLHWLRAQGRNVSRLSGKTNRLLGVVQDVTDRKAAEERIRGLNEDLERQVAVRTAELEASNAELDAFSYTVAHDLRSPVRAIIGFSETLSEECGQFLDEEGSHYLSRVHAAGVRMAEMIDALLKLAHISRVELRRSEVDLSPIAEAIMQELRAAEPQRSVNASIAKVLRANADPDLARIVLDNLLRNAWKFTSKRELASIEFGMLPSQHA